MALASRGRVEPPITATMAMRHWRAVRETSPERTKVWMEPKPRKAAVVYYLTRNGQLEQPHFMELPLAPGGALHLRDVLDRLNSLRGKGMADGYSWSSKRSYKNGFVWHDLTVDDLIHPTHGNEYVLKGSELLDPVVSSSSSLEMSNGSSSTCEKSPEMHKSVYRDDSEVGRNRRKKTAWSSFDLTEYKVYKTQLTAEPAAKAAADASTQTVDRRSRRRPVVVAREEADEYGSRAEVPTADPEENVNPTTELKRDEISPPPSSSSTETLESLIKAEGRTILPYSGPLSGEDEERKAAGGFTGFTGGRVRASAVLMQLISCRSFNVKDHHRSATAGPRQKGRMLPRVQSELSGKGMDGSVDSHVASPAMRVEEKEYFSGSLVEMKKKGREDGDGDGGRFSGLRKSSSYNADRSSKLEAVVAEKHQAGAARSKYIPKKTRPVMRREASMKESTTKLGRRANYH